MGRDERPTLVLVGVDALGLEDVQNSVDAVDEFPLQRPACFDPAPEARANLARFPAGMAESQPPLRPEAP
jgi:hypothetical protein